MKMEKVSNVLSDLPICLRPLKLLLSNSLIAVGVGVGAEVEVGQKLFSSKGKAIRRKRRSKYISRQKLRSAKVKAKLKL